jgi:hypothetical protein
MASVLRLQSPRLTSRVLVSRHISGLISLMLTLKSLSLAPARITWKVQIQITDAQAFEKQT